MKNFGIIGAIFIFMFAMQSFADSDAYIISKPCLEKLTVFAGEFAKISKVNYGQADVSIGDVLVNKDATLVGESGFADGNGSYEIKMVDAGESNITVVKFNFRFVTEPHCAVFKIQLTDLID